MKKKLTRIALATALALTPMLSNAQSNIINGIKNVLTGKSGESTTESNTSGNSGTSGSTGSIVSDIIGGITGKSEAAGTIVSAVTNLLGTSKVTADKLVGTWNYTQPCIAFESENALSKIGGTAVSSKIQSTLKKALEKAGISAGKVNVTFSSDDTFTITVKKKKFTGKYSVNGSDLTLTFDKSGKTVTGNVKLESITGTLQVAMKADKLLEVVNTIAAKASAYSSQMTTVSALLSNYSGMYLGMEFGKAK